MARRAEGLFIRLTVRAVPVIGLIGFGAFLVNPDWMAWSSIELPLWVRGVGVGLLIVAAALRIAVFHPLGTNLTDTVVTKADHTLVTTGPYRWVRHPLYVAFALAVFAYTLITANWFLGLTGWATAALLILRTGIEEQKLMERFGAEYTAYSSRTGRFFPRFRDAFDAVGQFSTDPAR